MPRSKVQVKSDKKYKYVKQEIVWAKTAGYSWWPASITSIPSKNKYFYKVDFIAPYVELRDEYECMKKGDRHFLNAVTIAGKKYQEWLVKQLAIMGTKASVECKTSQQKQQFIHQQKQLFPIHQKLQQPNSIQQPLFISPQNNIPKNTLQPPQALPNPIPTHNSHQHLPSQHQSLQQILSDQPDQDQNPKYIDQENREKLIQTLLAKYKLNSIPDLKEVRNAQKQRQRQDKDKRKPYLKRKLIGKHKLSQKYSTIEEDDSTEEDLMTRKIYRYLMSKLQSAPTSRAIALSLREQILKERATNKSQCFRKVIEWISVTDSQSIVNYESQWINFYRDTSEREREKHSSLTMEDESQEEILNH